MTQTEIASLALALLGDRALTDFDTDATQKGISARQWFAAARDEALRSHPWNFATVRKRLQTVYVALTGTAITNSSGLIKVTKTAHGLATGDRIYLKDVAGVTAANGRWYITVADANNFTLDNSVFSGTYTSATGSYVLVPNDGWAFQFALSSLTPVYLRVVKIGGCDGNDATDGTDYAIENGFIMTGCETIMVHYVYQHVTYTTWTQDFINAFSFLLASYIAQAITGPAGRALELRSSYEKTFKPLAASRDAREGKPRRTLPFDSSQLLQSRFGGYFPSGSVYGWPYNP